MNMRLHGARWFCLAILAAIAATSPAPPITTPMEQLLGLLTGVRGQLTLYKMQHDEQVPTLALMTQWEALLSTTFAEGRIGTNGMFGPYLREVPVNPLNGQWRVVAAGRPAADAGWTYDQTTGKLRAIVPAESAAQAARLFLPGDYELVPAAPATAPATSPVQP